MLDVVFAAVTLVLIVVASGSSSAAIGSMT
jgi:hypothetical protein